MSHVMDAFMEKVAISPALMARALAGRAAQGVGGAAALGKQVAGAAAGGATTSRQVMAQAGGLGKHRLQAVTQGGLAARKTEAAYGGAKAGFQGRLAAADNMPGQLNIKQPLRTHEGYMGNDFAYSKDYVGAIARPQGALHDPKGLLPQAKAPAALGTASTQLDKTVAQRRRVA